MIGKLILTCAALAWTCASNVTIAQETGRQAGTTKFRHQAHAQRPGTAAHHKSMKAGQESLLTHHAFGKQARKECEADRAQFCPDIKWGHGAAKCLNGQVAHLSATCARRVNAVCKKNQCPPELIR